jgi:hypothetical protein
MMSFMKYVQIILPLSGLPVKGTADTRWNRFSIDRISVSRLFSIATATAG